MKKYIAFTLAETLIALTIIGIIAAITVPMLITKYQKQVLPQQVKEAYSILSQAVTASVRSNGPVSSWELSNNSTALQTYILPYLKITKQLGMWDYQAMDMSNKSGYFWNARPYAMTNGMLLLYAGTTYSSNPVISIDVNGIRKPNMAGKDVFTFIINKNKSMVEIKDSDCTRDQLLGNKGQTHCKVNGAITIPFFYSFCSKTAGASRYRGEACAALIQKDGWKISDDYPW